jgi:hypothetical protein
VKNVLTFVYTKSSIRKGYNNAMKKKNLFVVSKKCKKEGEGGKSLPDPNLVKAKGYCFEFSRVIQKRMFFYTDKETFEINAKPDTI